MSDPTHFERGAATGGRFDRQWRQLGNAYHGAGPQAQGSPKG